MFHRFLLILHDRTSTWKYSDRINSQNFSFTKYVTRILYQFRYEHMFPSLTIAETMGSDRHGFAAEQPTDVSAVTGPTF